MSCNKLFVEYRKFDRRFCALNHSFLFNHEALLIAHPNFENLYVKLHYMCMKGNQSVKLLTGWDLGSGTVSQTLWSKLEHGSWNTHVVSLDPDPRS